MAFNIVDAVKDQLGPKLIEQIGGSLGENSERTGTAVAAAVPAMLAGLSKAAGTPAGADALSRAVDDQDPGLLNNLTSMISGGQAGNIASSGSNLLRSLLGEGPLGSIAGAIASFSGLGRGSANSVLGMVAPLIMSVLGSKKRDLGLDAGGLANMLADQQQNISRALPGEVGGALGSAGVFDNAAAHAEGSARRAGAAIQSKVRPSFFSKLIPAAAVLAIGVMAFRYFAPGGGVIEDAAQPLAQQPTEEAQPAAAATEAATEVAVIADGEIGDKLNGILGSATEVLGTVTDADSASAALPKLGEINENLSGITSMLDKLPESAKGIVTEIVAKQLPLIEEMAEKLAAIPGVGDVIKPALDSMLGSLRTLQA